MGADRPWRSVSYDDMDDPLAPEAFEHGHQPGQRLLLQLPALDQLVRDLAQRPPTVRADEGQEPPVDEQQLAITIAVGEGAEALPPQRHRLVQTDAVASSHAPPGSVDATHPVDGDLADQEPAQLLVAQLGAVVGLVLVLRDEDHRLWSRPGDRGPLPPRVALGDHGVSLNRP